MATVKKHKIKCYYAETLRVKPNEYHRRHFIHSKESGGLWANVRDLSQRERLANESVGNEVVLKMTIGYNPKFIELWEQLTIEFKGKTYRLKEKPDEFEYDKDDIKFNAYAYIEDRAFSEDVYEQ